MDLFQFFNVDQQHFSLCKFQRVVVPPQKLRLRHLLTRDVVPPLAPDQIRTVRSYQKHVRITFVTLTQRNVNHIRRYRNTVIWHKQHAKPCNNKEAPPRSVGRQKAPSRNANQSELRVVSVTKCVHACEVRASVDS